MIITGTLVEVGQLEDAGGYLGIVILRDNAEFVSISGLTEEETRSAAPLLFKAIAVTLAAGAPP